LPGGERKRWRFARAAVWIGLLLAAVIFWVTAGGAVMLWLR
jgi:hypothetical protein